MQQIGQLARSCDVTVVLVSSQTHWPYSTCIRASPADQHRLGDYGMCFGTLRALSSSLFRPQMGICRERLTNGLAATTLVQPTALMHLTLPASPAFIHSRPRTQGDVRPIVGPGLYEWVFVVMLQLPPELPPGAHAPGGLNVA